MIELPERIRSVAITCFEQPAGMLSQPAHYTFAYQDQAVYPCSLTMPIRSEPYHYGALHPVFAQNLPEGYVRRYISQRLERYATVNDLYLLALQHNNGIGHIGVQSEFAPRDYEQLSLEDILHWQGVEPIFEELLDRFYLRGMLSGVQPKVMVPVAGRPTIQQQDLIVKTFDPEFDLLTVNEFVCMSAAKACGLNPPVFWLSDDLNSFVIERFDRQHGQQFAFEDFTVLTGREKYRGSYETLLRATADYTQCQTQLTKAYRLIVFNCLIGNGDAHLKNFAIQYHRDGQVPVLTPPYDITHTLIYPTLDDRMALKMAGARTFPDRKTLLKLAAGAGIRQAGHIIDELADSISDFIENFDLIDRIPGFRESLRRSLALGTRQQQKGYRRDRNKKHPDPQ